MLQPSAAKVPLRICSLYRSPLGFCVSSQKSCFP